MMAISVCFIVAFVFAFVVAFVLASVVAFVVGFVVVYSLWGLWVGIIFLELGISCFAYAVHEIF